jgi:hypothetical protein
VLAVVVFNVFIAFHLWLVVSACAVAVVVVSWVVAVKNWEGESCVESGAERRLSPRTTPPPSLLLPTQPSPNNHPLPGFSAS